MACIGVIGIHAGSQHFRDMPLDSSVWAVSNFYHGINRFAVASFIMISGCLYLDSKRTWNLRRLWKRNILPIAAAYIFWQMFYAVYRIITNGTLAKGSKAALVKFMVYIIPGEGPCYRCIFRDLPAAGEIPTCKEAGVLGAVVGVIGSLEATEAVKLIAGVGEPLVARMLTVDALTMNIRRVPLPKHVPDCPVCGEQPTITAIDPANYIQPACAI